MEPSFPASWRAPGSTSSMSKNSRKASVTARFPGVRIPRPLVALFEKRAGYLDVEDCVPSRPPIQAVQRGASLRIGENVRGWKADRTSAFSSRPTAAPTVPRT